MIQWTFAKLGSACNNGNVCERIKKCLIFRKFWGPAVHPAYSAPRPKLDFYVLRQQTPLDPDPVTSLSLYWISAAPSFCCLNVENTKKFYPCWSSYPWKKTATMLHHTVRLDQVQKLRRGQQSRDELLAVNASEKILSLAWHTGVSPCCLDTPGYEACAAGW